MSEHIHRPNDPRIFVFGSNLLGIHGGGSAKYASRDLGAEWGVGEGFTGQTYALPTCIGPGRPASLEEVKQAITRFISIARTMPNLRFFISEVGCGIAGFAAADIAPMFANAPENCDLPPGWRA